MKEMEQTALNNAVLIVSSKDEKDLTIPPPPEGKILQVDLTIEPQGDDDGVSECIEHKDDKVDIYNQRLYYLQALYKSEDKETWKWVSGEGMDVKLTDELTVETVSIPGPIDLIAEKLKPVMIYTATYENVIGFRFIPIDQCIKTWHGVPIEVEFIKKEKI